MKELVVTSLLSARTKEPVVGLSFGGEGAQFSPAKAREIARMLMEAAESADTDAFVWQWATEQLHSTEDVAQQVVRDFRQYRETQLSRGIAVEEDNGNEATANG